MTGQVGSCHEHGTYLGDDNWDATCCMCVANPCPAITAREACDHATRRQEMWSAAHRRAVDYVLEHGHEEPNPW